MPLHHSRALKQFARTTGLGCTVLRSLGKNIHSDRYRYPVLERYYMARRALLRSRIPSKDALDKAREHFDDAHC